MNGFRLQSAFNSYLQAQEIAAPRLAALRDRVDAGKVLCAREDTYAPQLPTPLLLDPDQMMYLRHASERITALLTTELSTFMPDEQKLMDLLGPESLLRPFLQEKLPATVTAGRCDFLWSPSGWQLIEVNISGAIGGLDFADYHALLETDTFLGPYLREHGLGAESPSPMAALAERVLLACQPIAQSRRPVIAIVDAFGFDRIYNIGHQRLSRLYRAGGFETIVCNDRDLSLNHGHIFVHGTHVDAIHRQFVLEDMTESADFALPVLAAARLGNIALVSGFREEYLGVKGMLCVLRAAADQGALTPEDAVLVKAVVPETHLVHQLPPEILPSLESGEAAASDWVLKPSLGSIGTAVTLGPSVTRHSFREAVTAAAASDQPWVCQRYVPSEPVALPLLEDNALVLRECQIHPGILVIDGIARGAWVRAVKGRRPRVIGARGGQLYGSIFGPKLTMTAAQPRHT